MIYSYPKGRHYKVMGYIRVLKMRDGSEEVVVSPSLYRDGDFPERRRGWARLIRFVRGNF